MTDRKTIYIAADHAGFPLRGPVSSHLRDRGYEVIDLGPSALDPEDDYPDFAAAVGRRIRDDAGALGVLMCGSGAGVCIAANKFRGVRAAAVTTPETARLAREHNAVNVLCLGARLGPARDVVAVLDAWLDARAEGGRHARRVDKIAAIERQEMGPSPAARTSNGGSR